MLNPQTRNHSEPKNTNSTTFVERLKKHADAQTHDLKTLPATPRRVHDDSFRV